MTVIITLALGLRKLRAELRRPVEAWKDLTFLAHIDTDGTQVANIDQYEETSITPSASQSQSRSTFHVRFSRWACNNGKEIIRKLRWKIPTDQIAMHTIFSSVSFASNVKHSKILAALRYHGVPLYNGIARLGQWTD